MLEPPHSGTENVPIAHYNLFIFNAADVVPRGGRKISPYIIIVGIIFQVNRDHRTLFGLIQI